MFGRHGVRAGRNVIRLRHAGSAAQCIEDCRVHEIFRPANRRRQFGAISQQVEVMIQRDRLRQPDNRLRRQIRPAQIVIRERQRGRRRISRGCPLARQVVAIVIVRSTVGRQKVSGTNGTVELQV